MSRALALVAATALACGWGPPPAPEGAPDGRSRPNEWSTCGIAADCTWLIGEGGWPVAVNSTRSQDYQAWVQSQAPFTTYYTPSDCFAQGREFDEYSTRSESAIACDAGRCRIDLEPACTN
ncbi:MAG: hypothetical protein JRG76_15860 [Deltaproteobacteria bacterium]|nr:hypothetical protein [Deltaproteobacteria bacterium]MBW2415975.1 hypothetical protein [Deltaproteobacteria bacterium]